MAISVNINASTVGASIMNAADPSAISWIRVNADNTITYRTAAQTLSDLGAETALTFSTGLTRTVNTITIDSTVVTLTGSQALSNKTGLISQWTNDSGYLTSLAGAVTSVTGSGNIASTGGATPNLTFTGVLPTANGGTAVNIASAALVLGTASTTAGQLTLSNATNAFTQTIRGTNPAASVIYDLPTTAPTLGQVLSATAPAAGVVTLSWATASSGITVGTTTITSGTAGRLLYQKADNTVTQSASYYIDDATGANYRVLLAPEKSTSSFSASYVTLIGYNAGKAITSGVANVAVGSYALNSATTGESNTAVGHLALGQTGSGTSYSTAFGYNAGRSNSGNYGIYLGYAAGNNSNNASCIVICATNAALTTATHQGILGGNDANSYIDNWYFNGVTHTAAYSVNLRGSGGSGSNNVAANLNFYAGLSTGSGTPAVIGLYSSAAGASSSTAQTAVKVLEITNSTTITTTDAVNYALGSSTGTKWGTATTQKQAFWNATPIVQPTTAYAAATLVGGAGTNITDTDTFDGYTLKQIVAALRGIGLLA